MARRRWGWRTRVRWRGAWLLALLALAACSAPPWPSSSNPAATATRAAELAQLTQVAGTIESVQRTPTPTATATARVAASATARAIATPIVGGPTPTPARPPTQTPTPTPNGGIARTGGPTPTPGPTRTPAPPPTATAPNRTVTAMPTSALVGSATVIPLVANDLVYDPQGQRLYASVPGRAGAGGNSLVAIDPLTGVVGTPVFLGSEPNRLALADDGRYLYVTLDGAGAIGRYDIAGGQADLQITLKGGPNTGLCTATDIEVVPGLSTIIAVAQVCKPGGLSAGFVAYDGAQQLSGMTTTDQSTGDMAFCGADGALYRIGSATSLHIDAGGITAAGKQPAALASNGNSREIRCAGDRLYGSAGEVIDLTTGALAGRYTGLPGSTLVYPDAASGRTFFLDLGSSPAPRLSVYDQEHFTLLARVDFPTAPKPTGTTPQGFGHLVRWGVDGLAFLTGEQLVLIHSPLVSGGPVPPPPAGGTAATATPLPTPTRTPTPSASAPPPGTRVALATNDIISDPKSGKIYASVPGINGPNGNSVVPIDPATGALGTPIFVGSEPTTLALSDDGKYLYVVLSGASAIRRVDLAAQRAELQFSLGDDPREGPYTAGDIAVRPGHPDTVAVVLRGQYNATRGVALYIDGVKQPRTPNQTFVFQIDAIAFCSSPDALYGFDTRGSGVAFSWLTVSDTGIAEAGSLREIFATSGGFACGGGRIYATSGEVLDAATRQQEGKCPALGLVAPDSALGRTFYLTYYGNNARRVVVCDQRRFTLLGSFDVPAFSPEGRQHGFIRWGADGLAYRGGAGEIFLVRSPLVSGQP